jgi:thioredoxin reductase (NADPH)
MYAIGRYAVTKDLNLEKVGVKTNPHNGKLICVNEQTNIENIYAVGDVLDGQMGKKIE